MYWFDWLTLGIILLFAVLQAVNAQRVGGFSLSLFQCVFICLAVAAAVNLLDPVVSLIRLDRSTTLVILFAILGIGAWLGGRLLFSVTGWTLATFDAPLGFLFGAATGWAIAYIVLRIIVEQQGPAGPVAQNLPKAPIAAEIYWFRTWNRLLGLLFQARSGSEREMWNIDQHDL